MIVTRATREALSFRRDRFHLMFAALYAGQVDGYAASLAREASPLLPERLHIGGLSATERGIAVDEAMFVAIQCARSEPASTAGWSSEDLRDQARIRAAALGVSARVSIRMKMLEMRGETPQRLMPVPTDVHPIRHLDVLSLPTGRACLVGFAPLLRDHLVDGCWLQIQASGDGRTVRLMQRAYEPAAADTVETTFAMIENCDRLLVDLILAHRFVDLVVFSPEVDASGNVTGASFDVIPFRTPGRADDVDWKPDDEASGLMDALYAEALSDDVGMAA